MSGLVGADVEALRLLGTHLGSQADELEGLVSRLTARVGSAQWRGPDAERFRSEWSGRYSAMIRSAALAVRGASEAAKLNATQQDSVSGASEGVFGPRVYPNFGLGPVQDIDPGMSPGRNFVPDHPVVGDPGMTPGQGLRDDISVLDDPGMSPSGINLTPEQIQELTDLLGD